MESVNATKREINTTELVSRLMSHTLYDELRDEESLRTAGQNATDFVSENPRCVKL